MTIGGGSSRCLMAGGCTSRPGGSAGSCTSPPAWQTSCGSTAPYYREGEAPKTSINVSESKDAQRIAADVRRRLLPEYEREAAACAANKARHDDNNAKRVAALTKVAAPFGERVQCDERIGRTAPAFHRPRRASSASRPSPSASR